MAFTRMPGLFLMIHENAHNHNLDPSPINAQTEEKGNLRRQELRVRL